MSLPSLLTHRATFTRQAFTTSAAGDTVKSGAWERTTLVDVACRASQASGGTDALVQRDRYRTRWTLILNPTTDVRARDRATVTLDDGTTVVVEVTEVRRLTTPGRTHHMRLDAEEVDG